MSKISPFGLAAAHRRTYVDANTGKRRWSDHVLIEGIPMASAVGVWFLELELDRAASAALLAATGLFGALLFGAMLQVADRALNWSDTQPKLGRETSSRAKFLGEIAANAGYASLVAIAGSAAFVVTTVTHGRWLRLATAVALGLAVHLVFVLLMVMRRVYQLTIAELNRMRTGADREESTSERKLTSL